MTAIHLNVDVLVIGAGFGGSLTALLLNQIGLKCAVLERGSHPRFALGESATPLADLVLGDLALRYGLPRLAPLAEYGTWQKAYPELVCGLKRGFSYFHHRRHEPWQPSTGRANELLIAASKTAADADTHWLRSQFDHFLAREAQQAGVEIVEHSRVEELNGEPPWRLSGTVAGQPLSVDASFLIDASGEGRVLARLLAIADGGNRMRTCSRSIYGHFSDVESWSDVVAEAGGDAVRHPFPCDDAALHHVFDGGWMWMLRFNNGVTSAGWLIDSGRFPLVESLTAVEEWSRWLAEFPSIARQFRHAQLVNPPDGLRRTARLQRRVPRAAADGWAMLPASAYTLDALHSTGNAHTLAGVERLVQILEGHWQKPELAAKLAEYDQILQAEISHLDRLVHGSYRSMGQFELFAAFSMFYFIAAHNSEARRREGRVGEPFLWAAEPAFQAVLEGAYQQLLAITDGRPASADEIRAFARRVSRGLEPFNIAGLQFPDGEGFAGGLVDV
ncbi:MAG TPA: FAD-dependent oxidoreductase [Pirellulales bacterium]|nr:FAD-dependent oxidoreductase [Pirellulales bacterium]